MPSRIQSPHLKALATAAILLLALDAPASANPAEELLLARDHGSFFTLVLKDSQVQLSDVSLRDDGKLVARSADGAQSVVFAMNRGAKYLALRLEELTGVPAASPVVLDFQMNPASGARVVELDYMTQAYGSRLLWKHLWHRNESKADPLGGFALYVRENDEDEDDTLLHIWAEEKLPHPKVAGEWTYERARQWMSDWQKLFADRSQMILEGTSLAELREAIPFAERAQIKEIYLFTNTWRTEAFWTRTDTSWGVNRKVFPRGEEDLKAFADELRAKGLRLNLHYLSGGIGMLDPLYVADKPARRLASWGGGSTHAAAVAGNAIFNRRPSNGGGRVKSGSYRGKPCVRTYNEHSKP